MQLARTDERVLGARKVRNTVRVGKTCVVTSHDAKFHAGAGGLPAWAQGPPVF